MKMHRILFTLTLAIGILDGCREPDPTPVGEWEAFASDPKYELENNPCTLVITSQGGPDISIKCTGKDNQWTCDGRGTFRDRQFTFRWKGPKNWSGTVEGMISADGKSFVGTYHRWDDTKTFYCKGRKRK